MIESTEGIRLVPSPSLASASGPTEPPTELAAVRMTAEAGDTNREEVAAPTAGLDVDLDRSHAENILEGLAEKLTP